jgi:putative ABC transport system permease protein
MLKSHIIVALRTIARNRGYTAINLFGLAVGLTCFLLIALFVRDELSYDRFHLGADRIHRVVVDQVKPDGSIVPRIPTPDALGLALPQEIPQVEAATRIMPSYWGKRLLTQGASTVQEDNLLMVDSAFFEVFSVTFLHGDAQNAMAVPASIVLTRSTALRLFWRRACAGKNPDAGSAHGTGRRSHH